MKNSSVILVFLVLLAAATSLGTSTEARLLQTTVRTATSVKMCANYPTRDSLVDAKAQADADSAKTSMKSSFKA